jgi:drug/metabolite transporter (DMT)-like permease
MDKKTIAILVTIGFSVLGVIGDYFLKLASEKEASLKTAQFYLGFVIYASTAFGWVYVMKHLKLAQVGVLYCVSMVLLLAAIGVFRFKETLSVPEIAGIAMAIGALVLLMRFN